MRGEAGTRRLKGAVAGLVSLGLALALLAGCEGQGVNVDLGKLFKREEPPPPAPPRAATVLIRLTADDRVILNEDTIPLTTVGVELQAIAKKLDDAVLTARIVVDDEVPFGRLRIVRQACLDAGIAHIELSGP